MTPYLSVKRCQINTILVGGKIRSKPDEEDILVIDQERSKLFQTSTDSLLCAR